MCKVKDKNYKANWDRPYKVIFSNPDIVKDLITTYYDADWVRDIDFTTLQKFPTEFIGEELDETRDDVIWQVNFKDTKLYILLLLEFQSNSDSYMAARILSYVGNLYLDIIRTQKQNSLKKLPPVFPLVIYNGKNQWNASKSFKDIVSCPYTSLSKYIPDIFYEVFDEKEVFQKISNPQRLIDLLVSIQFCDNPETMRTSVSQLCKLAEQSESFDHLLRGFVLLIRRGLMRSGKWSEQLSEVNWDDISTPQEVNNMLETTLKNWADNCYIKGKKEGKEEGREEGRDEGKALALLELLADGDISFDKAKLKLDILKSADPKADFWDSIYERLNAFKISSNKFNDPSAEYNPTSNKP